ncbi:MAG: PhzF family phenazine biosynthesis protein, partial [Flavobacteriales bacterium]|nr:PhzF family phenazine biosynthesis protein [Flavobacteriales bacterium]
KSDYLFVYDSEVEIANLLPDFEALKIHQVRGIIVTAPGETTDFVSRFFAPQSGINEDPVTGSAHTTLTAYWSKKLGKNQLHAQQLSNRGGQIDCELLGNRVELTGKARTYLIGEYYLD